MALTLKGLWSKVTGNVAAEVAALLAAEVHPQGVSYFLPSQLERLAQQKAFDDDGAVLALLPFAHVPLVHERLAARPLEQLGRVLSGAVLELDALTPHARAAVDAWFAHVALRAPETILPDARARAEAVRAEGGRAQPEAAWRSPWAAAPKKKAKKIPVAEVPAFEEKFHDHPDPPVNPPRGGTLDREAVARWRVGEHVVNPINFLLSMNRESALGFWKSTKPSLLYLYGDVLDSLVPWLGLEVLDQSLAFIHASPAGLSALRGLESPRAAPLMAMALGGKPDRHELARAWFARFPEAAVLGLVPEAAGTGKEAAKATLALLHLRRLHADAMAKALQRFPPEVRAWLDDKLAVPAELPVRKPALPDFLVPEGLPRPVTVDGKAVAAEAHADLIALLKAAPLEGAPWVDALKGEFTERSLALLARALFQLWLANGAPPKERWMLYALAHFPDDAVAQMLAEQAADLAPKGLSSRAQEMVEVLAAMRTRTSLKLVHQLQRKVRSKAFRARAEQIFVTAAEKMGLTEDELAERLVPDYGLAPDGTLPIEPKTVLVRRRAKAVFVDANNHEVKSVPVPADPELAAELAELQKKAKGLMKETAERLERRMVRGRTMSVEHFTETMLMHGLARRVAELLVWGVYGKGLERAFVLEDAAAVLDSAQGKQIGVVHPLELDAAQKASFAQRLGEQPFAQLDRKNRPVTTIEALRTAVREHLQRTVPTGDVLKLEKLGWARGEMVGGGCYASVARTVSTGTVEVLFNPGVYLGDPMMNATQVIEDIDVRLDGQEAAVVLSELEHDLRTAFGSR